MTLYTSTQNGNFSDVATWGGGGYPVDGDTFYISVGDTVIFDITSAIANGYGDSNVYGTLIHDTTGTTVLKLEGILYVRGGGKYEMVPGSTLDINCAIASDLHGLRLLAEADAKIIATGSAGNPETTLSEAIAIGDATCSLTSISGMAVGDWVSIFDRGATYNTQTDEGFWVHDISGTIIYMREFVGPTTQVDGTWTGDNFYVDNAKVFRVGYQLIIGTGANRNIITITDINYRDNLITVDSYVTGTIVDNTDVYTTGFLKPHTSGNIVQKVATTLTSVASESQAVINVGDIGNIAAGDNIYIEYRGTDSVLWSVEQNYEVDSVDGNEITLTSNLDYIHEVGTIIGRLTRDCRIISSNYGYIYSLTYSADDTRVLTLENVEMKGLGNVSGTAYSGLLIYGNIKYDTYESDTQPNRIDSCTFHSSNYAGGHTGINQYSRSYKFTIRNSISMDAGRGIRCGWGDSQVVCNNISARNNYCGLVSEGINDPRSEFSYNYISRCDDYGMEFRYSYEQPRIHMNFIRDMDSYALYTFALNPVLYLWRMYIQNYANQVNFHSPMTLIDSYLDSYNETDTVKKVAGDSRGAANRLGSRHARLTILERNFEYDNYTDSCYQCFREWSNTEQAWWVRRGTNTGVIVGFTNEVFVPANTTVRVSAKIKLVSGFSGSYPYLRVADLQSQNQGTTSFDGRYQGGYVQEQFTVVAESDYEEKQITLTVQPYPRFITAYVFTNSSTASEGYYEKPIKIMLDKPRHFESNTFDFYTSNMRKSISSTFNERKIRIAGGRI